MEARSIQPIPMRCLELFSGAGGLALGLEKAGFQHAALVERDADACATLRLNQADGNGLDPACLITSADVRTVRFAELAPGVDLVAGGPPCQPFSMGGKARGFEDSRDMFPQAIRAVEELQPKAFIFENVRGLLRPAFRNYVEFIKLRLEFPGFPVSLNVDWETNLRRLQRHKSTSDTSVLRYSVFLHSANAADFGVPQKRHRIFFIGFRQDLDARWSFPSATHSQERLDYDKHVTGAYWERCRVPLKRRIAPPASMRGRLAALRSSTPETLGHPWRTVREALLDLPEPGSPRASGFSNHKRQDGARAYPGHTGSPLDEPAKALKAGDHGVPGGENMMAHSDGSVRYFTVRESARLQTFPDSWRFPGSWTESMRQLGNAVPVDLAAAVGRSVLNALHRAQEFIPTSSRKQSRKCAPSVTSGNSISSHEFE